jgi:hypothetical protein
MRVFLTKYVCLNKIENEYQHMEAAFKENGTRYIEWAAKMAISTGTGVPWIMCKQTKAPHEVVTLYYIQTSLMFFLRSVASL